MTMVKMMLETLKTALVLGLCLTVGVCGRNVSNVDNITEINNQDHLRAALADDLDLAASEIHEAAIQLGSDAQGNEKEETTVEPSTDQTEHHESSSHAPSEGIEHEEGNIPFEWRVQLIHKRFGDSWANRDKHDDSYSGANSERGWERFQHMPDQGQTREHYTKKKFDILVEEWWNKEKWNRNYWDEYESDRDKHRDQHAHRHNQEYKEHRPRSRSRSKHRSRPHHQHRQRQRHRNHHYHPSDGESRRLEARVTPKSHLISDDTKRTGDHSTQHTGQITVQKYGKPNELKNGPTPSKDRNREKDFNREVASTNKNVPACARLSPHFCQKDPEYPEAIISELIRINNTAFQKVKAQAEALWKPFLHGSEKNKHGRVINSTPRCHGSESEAKPLWAPNSHGNWKIIVNTKDLEQTFITEHCTKQTWNCAAANGKRCKQKFDKLPLVAVDLFQSSPHVHLDWFVLPSKCTCNRHETPV